MILPTTPATPPTPDSPISLLADPAAAGHPIVPFVAPAGPADSVLQEAAIAGTATLTVISHPGAGHPQSDLPDKPASAHKPQPASGPGLPCGGGAGGSAASAACASGGGSGHGVFLALLFTLGGLSVLLSTLLRLPPARWRPAAFIALLERPG
ncbi:MAG TPA: hypothetical protein VN606_15180 [Thermoleophilaceae bacterium]|nr:hypothetical protein [Thermoleophilaceae bacterium]